MDGKPEHIEVEHLRNENAWLKRALVEAGIDFERATHSRSDSEAQQAASLVIGRAETSVARSEVQRIRREAVATEKRHSEQAQVAASALATSQALVAALKLQDRRQAALIELGESLRDVTEVVSIVQIGTQIAARAIDASRAAYGVVDPVRETVDIANDWCAPGTTSITGFYHFRDFGSFIDELKRGETVVIDDASQDPRTRANFAAFEAADIFSLINVPLVERGTLAAIAIVQHNGPHHWTVEELAFITAAADRIRAAVARREAESRQAMLNGEIAHRLKNTLSIVQAITTQTLRNASSTAEAQKILSDRLMAIGNAHDALMAGSTDATRVTAVVKGALALHNSGDERVRISGPEITIGPSAAMSLALMLHELATNAAKYGAFSVPLGAVDLSWKLEDAAGQETFALNWTERNGPPVSPPSRRGFGSRLIERGFGAGAEVTLCFDASGVVADLRAPLAGLQGGIAPR